MLPITTLVLRGEQSFEVVGLLSPSMYTSANCTRYSGESARTMNRKTTVDAFDAYNFELKENVLSSTGWSTLRRERTLARPEIQKLKSVSNDIWLTCFDEKVRSRVGRIREPLHADYRRSMRNLVDFVRSLSPEVFQYLTPVALFYGDHSTAPSEYGENFVGYDVVDPFSLSGIFGFERDTIEMTELRGRFAWHLNDVHLFSDYNCAADFSRYMDSWAPEHGPFSPVGIFELKILNLMNV